jgi:hypothetical protein
MLYLINISSSMSPEDASYILKVLDDKLIDLLSSSNFFLINPNILISGAIQASLTASRRRRK